MIIKVYNYNENKIILDFKIRKNSKTIIKKIREELEKKYNCKIRNVLPTGKIDFATGISNIQYVLFGDNLPCKIINYTTE